MALVSAPIPDVHAEWAAIAESRAAYTDNVFEFSAARRQALSEDPSQPIGIATAPKSDVVWDPSLELIRASSNAIGANEWSIKAHGFLYTQNPIFNHGDYRIQLRQGLSPLTSVLFRYRYVPNLFLGPNIERRTGSQQIAEERVTSHIGRVEVEQKFGQRWTATVIARGGARLYNEAFAERDTRFWTLGPQVSYAPLDWLTASLGYLYERGYADGAGVLQYQDDVSYHQHVVSTSVDLVLTDPLSLRLLYLFRRKDFTSDLLLDTHTGRQDDTHQGAAELRYALSRRAAVMAGFRYTQRTSTNISRDFHETQTWVGAEYRF